MKKPLSAVLALVVALGFASGAVSAQALLSGDTRLACEAILCLSSSTRPSECTPSLSRYFGIQHRKWSDTVNARLNFLQLCPVAQQTPQMQSLVSSISQGAGRCDAQSLNASLVIWIGGEAGHTTTVIGNQLPEYCVAYTGHAHTSLGNGVPRYVGTPERGGYWVEAGQYDRALAGYNERIRREDEERGRPSLLN